MRAPLSVAVLSHGIDMLKSYKLGSKVVPTVPPVQAPLVIGGGIVGVVDGPLYRLSQSLDEFH